MELPVLLFDWDGVIADTNAWKWGGAWREVFAGEPQLLVHVERVLAEDVEKRLNRHQLVEETIRRAAEAGCTPRLSPKEYADRFGEAVRTGTLRVGLFPGARDTLASLHAAGHRMYVISMTAQRDLEHAAREFGVEEYFIELRGMPGTKPEHAKDISMLEPEDATYVVIGDGAGDRALAEQLGCPFIGVVNEWNGWANDATLAHKVRSITDVPRELELLA